MNDINENMKTISMSLMKLRDLEENEDKKELIKSTLELSLITYKLLNNNTNNNEQVN